MATMQAWLLERLAPVTAGSRPLRLGICPRPEPGPGEIRLRVQACGICHTELDEIEGRTPPPRLPVIPGHQAVGVVDALGAGCSRLAVGARVGVAWIFSACGGCAYCRSGRENLCPEFRATGRDRNGGYAEWLVVPEAFAFAIPDTFTAVEAAPLLCAGAIGYRSLALAGLTDGQALGLTGFGGSAHQVLAMARHRFPHSPVFVFARKAEERAFALAQGADWAGDTTDTAPQPLDAIIDTTPAWTPVVAALGQLAPGGRLVINAIRKQNEDRPVLLELDYPQHLWQEKTVQSVANVTRADVSGFLALAADIGLRPSVQRYAFAEANQALIDLRTQPVRGSKVLLVGD